MRTTITIDDELYRRAKERAARDGRTISDVVEHAVRRYLGEEDSGPVGPLPPLPTYGGGGVLPGVALSSNAALRDQMDGDGDEPVDALR